MFPDGKAQGMHGIKGIGRSSCRRTVSSSNHVGGRVLTPISSGDCINLTFCRRKLWLMGGTIHAGMKTLL